MKSPVVLISLSVGFALGFIASLMFSVVPKSKQPPPELEQEKIVREWRDLTVQNEIYQFERTLRQRLTDDPSIESVSVRLENIGTSGTEGLGIDSTARFIIKLTSHTLNLEELVQRLEAIALQIAGERKLEVIGGHKDPSTFQVTMRQSWSEDVFETLLNLSLHRNAAPTEK